MPSSRKLRRSTSRKSKPPNAHERADEILFGLRKINFWYIHTRDSLLFLLPPEVSFIVGDTLDADIRQLSGVGLIE